MQEKRSIGWTVFWKIVGLIIFLVLVYIVNLFANVIENPILDKFLYFINANIFLLIAITIIFLVGEILMALQFPLNMPAPFFNAIAAVLLVSFIFKLFEIFEQITTLAVYRYIKPFEDPLYFVVFTIVLVVGLITILAGVIQENSREKKQAPIEQKRGKSWGDVGLEFRETISALLASIRRKANDPKKK